MNYANIKYFDIANGPGARTTLFVSGCRRHCPGCFNTVAWDFSYGRPFDSEVADEIVESLGAPYVAGLSVLGGEPFEPENQEVLAGFLERVRRDAPTKSVWCYTGDVYEDLLRADGPHRTDDTDRLLACLDVLVDGAWEHDLKDISLRFRGSSNQRIIDMAATRETGHVVPWSDRPIYATHDLLPHTQGRLPNHLTEASDER